VSTRFTPALLVLVLAGCTSVARSPAGSPSQSTPPTPPAPPTHAPAGSSSTSAPASTSSATERPAPSASTVPPLPAKARAAGLVDVRTVVPDAVVDLRYATAANFTHVRLYPRDARCLVHRTMVAGLRTAAARLRAQGYRLVFWDCYRPHAVQVRMWQVVPNANWVARPTLYARSHESGRSVDVTLERGGRLVDMGTGFDDFTPRAYAFASAGLTATQIADRARLRHAMNAGGLAVYSGEWWHFDGPGADVPRPILDAPLD
jgi:D-alanyl-D-alanine dipeptidase